MMAVSAMWTGRNHRKVPPPFADWRNDGHVQPVPPPAEKPLPPSIISTKRPQSTIIVDFWPRKKSPIHIPSPFSISSWEAVVSDRGSFRISAAIWSCYSTGSFYEGREGYGVFGSYAITKSEATGTVLSRLLQILQDIGHRQVLEDELAWPRMPLSTVSFSLQLNRLIATQQMMTEFHGLPFDYLRAYRGRIEAVNREDILRVAAQYLRDDRATTLVVGDEQKFDRPLSTFGTFIKSIGNRP